MGYAYGLGYGHTWRNTKRRVATSAAGGAALLVGETDGFATDFTYATDAQRVAVKASTALTYYAVDSFYQNAGTSPKMVWSSIGTNNALKWSEDFSNALWATDGSTNKASNVTTAPNGTATADQLVEVGGIGAYVYQTIPATVGANVFSVYAKISDAGVPYLELEDWEGARADLFNLSTGLVEAWHPNTAVVPSGGAAIQAIGNGWYRCSMPLKPGCITPTIHPVKSNTGVGATDFTIPVGQGVFLWGAQINAGTAPTSYVATGATAASDAGTLGWSPHNMCLQSQSFEQTTPWNPTTAVTVTANAIAAPDGTLTADRIVETAINATHQLLHSNITTITGETYTYSVYAKAGERSWLSICPANTTSADWFDLANGVMGTTATGGVITPAGSGWYRCSVTQVAPGTTRAPVFHIHTANGETLNYLGDITKGLYLWGAQLNRGSVPTAYLPTTTAARFGLALDYDPVTHASKGLWAEPTATNTVTWSNALNDVTWSLLNGTISADAVMAPDGTTTADRLVETAVAGEHKVYKSIAVTAVAYTWSFYAKAAERTWLVLTLVDTASFLIYYNLGTGAIGTVAAGCTATMTAVGNGWYRCTATHTMVAGSTYIQFGTATGDTVNSFTGDITKGLYIWGAQLETGAVATSPIPTFAASVTRAGDLYNVTSASIGYSATAGSWWIDAYLNTTTAGRVIGYVSTVTPITVQGATTFQLFDPAGANIAKTVTSTIGAHKLAATFQAADAAITADGLAVTSTTGATTNLLAPGSPVYIGSTSTVATNGYFRKLRYVPRRKTNAELVTETT